MKFSRILKISFLWSESFRPQETNLLGFLASFSLVFDVRNLYRATRDVMLSCLFWEKHAVKYVYVALWHEMVSSMFIREWQRLFVMFAIVKRKVLIFFSQSTELNLNTWSKFSRMSFY